MNSKKWCIAALIALLCAILFVVVLNLIVDPFGAFGDEWYSYNFTNNPRVAKIEYLKKNHQKYDSYIIGCSSTSSFPVKELNQYLDANFYNMIMYGGDMLDVEQTAYYIGENYEMKNLVVNLYISNGVNYGTESDPYTRCMHYLADNSSPVKHYLKFAFANPQYSFAKIADKKKDRYLSEPFDVFDVETGTYDKRKRDAEKVSDLESFYKDYPVFLSYPSMPLKLSKIDECMASLKRIKEYCDKKGINFIPVNGPVYYDYFKCVSKEDVEKYYKGLASVTPFWDFSVSSVSLDPRFFYDDTHFRNDIGRMMFAQVFDKTAVYVAPDFGTYVTTDNVSEYVESLYGKTFSDELYTTKLPVLLYHHIAPNPENDMAVSPETFEMHMKTLKDNSYNTITVDDIIEYIDRGTDLPENPVLITFDDGYYSNYEYAYPILKKYGLKATVFAVGETYGKSTYPGTDVAIYPHFGDKERKEMEGVIDVYSHSYGMHQSSALEESVAYENMVKQENETDIAYVERAKADWDKWIETVGYAPKALAFPHGASDLLTQAVLNECGIRVTFSTEQKADTLIKGVALSGNSIGRFSVYDTTTAQELLNLVSVN